MRFTFTKFFVILMLIIIGIRYLNQTQVYGQPAIDSSVRNEDINSIKVLIDDIWKILQEKNIDLFMERCSKDWTLYTARGNKFNVVKLFEIHKSKIKNFNLIPSHIKINVVGNMAWATYDAEMLGLFNGKPWGGKFIFTNIFRKMGNKWICIHMHESKRASN